MEFNFLRSFAILWWITYCNQPILFKNRYQFLWPLIAKDVINLQKKLKMCLISFPIATCKESLPRRNPRALLLESQGQSSKKHFLVFLNPHHGKGLGQNFGDSNIGISSWIIIVIKIVWSYLFMDRLCKGLTSFWIVSICFMITGY